MIQADQILKFSPCDGDLFVVPADVSSEQARELAEAISIACPGIKAMVFCGELRRLDPAEMNAAGWYRK